jgi:hypothetical protein
MLRHWAASPSAGAGVSDTLFAGAPMGINTPANEPITRGNMSSIRAGDLYYILNGDGVEELYDLAKDPAEEINLARSAEFRPILDDFRRPLRARFPPAWWAHGSYRPPGSPVKGTAGR